MLSKYLNIAASSFGPLDFLPRRLSLLSSSQMGRHNRSYSSNQSATVRLQAAAKRHENSNPKRERVQMNTYRRINVGCGRRPTNGWENVDNSPSLKLARFPAIVAVLRGLGLGSEERRVGK